MAVDTRNLVLGGVDYIDIDGSQYEVYGDDGVTIAMVSDITRTPVVGTPEPRIRQSVLYFTVNCSMIENSLANLRLMWNMPNTLSYGATADYMYLGLSSAPTTHILQVIGYGVFKADYSEQVARTWYFRKAISYDTGPQEMRYSGTVVIPTQFVCYPDSTQVAGIEFGYVEQEKTS